MKPLFLFLVACLALVSCNRTPTACFMPLNVKFIDTISLGETLNFDAGCSIHATKFSWIIKDSLQTVDSNVVLSNNKYYSHKFEHLGLFTIRLTAKNSSGVESNTEQYYFIKP